MPRAINSGVGLFACVVLFCFLLYFTWTFKVTFGKAQVKTFSVTWNTGHDRTLLQHA